MPNILQEYLVKLGWKIDEQQFKNFKFNLAKTAKQFEELGKVAFASASALTASVILVAENLEKLYFASQRTGASAKNLRSFGQAAEQIGVSSDEALSAVEGLSRSVRLNPGLQGYLRALSVNPNQDGVQRLLDLVDRLSTLFPGEDKFYMRQQIAGQFGIDDQTLLMLEKNRVELGRFFEQRKALNKDTDEQTRKSHEFNQAMRDMADKFATLGNTIASRFMPMMDRLIPQIERLVDFFLQADKTTSGWSSRLLGLGVAIGGVVGSMALLKGVGSTLAAFFGIGGAAAGGAAAGAGASTAAAGGTVGFAGGIGSGGVAAGAGTTAAVGGAAMFGSVAGGGLALAGLEAWIFHRLIGDQKIRAGASDESMRAYSQLTQRGYMLVNGKIYKRVGNQWLSADQLVGKDKFSGFIDAAAAKYGVSSELLRGIMQQESGGNPNAMSKAGALGLMQLMPQTAKTLGVDPMNPEQNIDGGARYISDLMKRYGGDTSKALAAYNAGPGNVDKYGGVPPFAETQDYVRRIMGHLTGDGTLAAKVSSGIAFTQNTNIYVTGNDARGTGEAVLNNQQRVNGDLVRNLAGVTQ